MKGWWSGRGVFCGSVLVEKREGERSAVVGNGGRVCGVGKEKKGCGGIQGRAGGDGDKWLHGTTSVPLATVNFGLKASG